MLAQLMRIALAREQNRRSLNVACIGLLLAYFLHFALPALRAGFGEDEMMNLYFYWFPGAFRSIRANFCFWSISYPQRPAGALLVVLEHGARALGILAAHDPDPRDIALGPVLVDLLLAQNLHFAAAVSSCCCRAKIEL